jgi:hypothetical protein
MIAKKLRKIIWFYRLELSCATIFTGLVFIACWVLVSQQAEQYEKTLENQLQKFRVISNTFIEEVKVSAQNRESMIERLDALRSALSWHFKISFDLDQDFGQIKIPIIVDGSGFNIENRKKIGSLIVCVENKKPYKKLAAFRGGKYKFHANYQRTHFFDRWFFHTYETGQYRQSTPDKFCLHHLP